MTHLDWDQYLGRIGAMRTDVSLDALRHLQRQALLRLPFENLDIHLGRPIDLDLAAVHAKVTGPRGGFCYELNECLYQCLVTLGFCVQRLEARVDLGGPGAPYDHQCLRVEVDGGRWLVDAGMGDSTLVPLDLDDGEPQTDGRGWYRVDEGEGGYTVRRQWQPEAWSGFLTVNAEPQPWSAFTERCRWMQSSAGSVFTGKRLCTRATAHGRVRLSGNTFKETDAMGRVRCERRVDEANYVEVLAEHFGVVLEAPRWQRPVSPGR